MFQFRGIKRSFLYYPRGPLIALIEQLCLIMCNGTSMPGNLRDKQIIYIIEYDNFERSYIDLRRIAVQG